MPVPTYDKFIEPILRQLAAHPEAVAARDVHEAAAVVLASPTATARSCCPAVCKPSTRIDQAGPTID
jgi:hypothetical protein